MEGICWFGLLTFYTQVYLMTPEEGGRKKPCTKDMQLVFTNYNYNFDPNPI